MRIREPFFQRGESHIVTLPAQWIAFDDFVMMYSGADIVDHILELHKAVQVLSQHGYVATNDPRC